MLGILMRKIFGSRNERIIKQLSKNVRDINALEAQMQALDNEALGGKTQEFKSRLAAGETLDQLLVEAFAVVREASRRVLGMRHYDVQLIGGMVLHMGKIAEMRTGEGKTLVATLAVYRSRRKKPLIERILLTARIMSSALIICAAIWRLCLKIACKES